jgi:hypothetical protein
LFEDLCHALITRKSDKIPPHHFEFVDWTSGIGIHPRLCLISQIAIPNVKRIDGKVSDIGRPPWNETWYFVPKSDSFKGLDALYYDSNTQTLYLLQMTVAKEHDPVSLKKVHKLLEVWITDLGQKAFFVTLVDTRDRQRLYLAKTRSMIDPSDPFFEPVKEKVGVLCGGPIYTEVKSLADFSQELMPLEWH